MRIYQRETPLGIGDYAIVVIRMNGREIRGAICRYSTHSLTFASNDERLNGCYDLPRTAAWQHIRNQFTNGWAIGVRSCRDFTVLGTVNQGSFQIGVDVEVLFIEQEDNSLVSITTTPCADSCGVLERSSDSSFFYNKYESTVVYSGIHSYHRHHCVHQNESKKQKNGYRVGVELEVEFKNQSYKDSFSNSKSNWFYMERDGSLNERGCEIITIPMYPVDIKSPKLWNPLVDALSSKARSWDSSRCGLHIHIGRMLTSMNGEVKSNTIIVGGFNTPLTIMYRSTKQKISKETQTLNDTMDQLSGATLGIADKMEARSPTPSPHSAGTDPGMKDLSLVILTCLFLSLAELTEKEY